MLLLKTYHIITVAGYTHVTESIKDRDQGYHTQLDQIFMFPCTALQRWTTPVTLFCGPTLFLVCRNLPHSSPSIPVEEQKMRTDVLVTGVTDVAFRRVLLFLLLIC